MASFGYLLRVITDCYGKSDHIEGAYSFSFESNEWRISWNHPFSLNPHLLERRVVEDISRASIVYKDSVSVVVPNPYPNYKRIVV